MASTMVSVGKPFDIQCCAQAIDMLVFFHEHDLENLSLALK